MHESPMLATMSVHLEEGMDLNPRVTSSGNGVLSAGTWSNEHWELNLFGSPAALRQLAEVLYQLADGAERKVNRQRALDNAPVIRRTKFVLEGEETTTLAA